MTDTEILALAQKHSAYADTAPTLRGADAILAFARELMKDREAHWVDWMLRMQKMLDRIERQ